MLSALALWQELALLALALLSLVYVYYFRIWIAVATGSDLLFSAALGVCVASVATPTAFDAGARRIVEWSPLPAALVEADARVAALERLPRSLIESALERLGYEPTPESTENPAPTPGPFEARIRPAVESLVGLVLRITSGLGSLFLLMTALALRSSTATARELDKLSTRLDELSEA